LDASIDTLVLVKSVVTDLLDAIVEFDLGVVNVIRGVEDFTDVLDRMIPRSTIQAAKDLANAIGQLAWSTDLFKEEGGLLFNVLGDIVELPVTDWVTDLSGAEDDLKDKTEGVTKAFEDLNDVALKRIKWAKELDKILAGHAEDEKERNKEGLSDAARNAQKRFDFEMESADRITEIRQEQADEAEAIAEAALAAQASATESLVQSTLGAVGTFTDIAMNAILRSSEELTEGQKEAALALFVVNKVAAVATGAINTALAISNALGSTTPPANFILAAAAGIAGGVATAAIAAEPPPSFDVGGVASQVNASLQVGEGVIKKQRVQEMPTGEIDRINREGYGGGGRVVVVNQTNNRTTFAAEYEATRTGVSPYDRRISAIQPKRLGLRVLAA